MRNHNKSHFTFHNSQRGQAIITAVVFFLVISIVVISSAVVATTKRAAGSNRLINSKKSYFVTEAGIEDLAYRIMNSKAYDSTENLLIDGFTATTVVVNTVGLDKEVTTIGDVLNNQRKVKITLTTDSGAAFFYGVQSGAGGTFVGNGTSFAGSLYSNGPIKGENNLVYGTVVSAGPLGLIENIHATGTAYAHTIDDSTIEKDAYYQHIIDPDVRGVSYPGSEDKPILPMPVTDTMVQGWEDSAATNVISGCSGGSLTISTNRTLGPAKIPCNLILSANLTLTGPVWVEGNITLGNNADTFVDASLGANSVALIADKPTDRLNSSRVMMTNGATFTGSGDLLSYVFLVSMNNSAENGGTVIAIDVNNNLNGDLFVYAPHGYIDIHNGANLVGMAGYKIDIKNNAIITYENGLASMLFESGPSGGFSIKSWEETE